jgi:hypothetical protein
MEHVQIAYSASLAQPITNLLRCYKTLKTNDLQARCTCFVRENLSGFGGAVSVSALAVPVPVPVPTTYSCFDG